MNNLNSKTYNLINKLVDFDDINNVNFYNNILSLFSNIYSDASLAIFFCENSVYKLKHALLEKNKSFNKDYSIDEKLVDIFFDSNADFKIIKTQKDELLKANTLFVKMSIKDSVFGFCTLSSEKEIDSQTVDSFVSAVKVFSYKIKDYELNEVFKIQLKAMQDAFIEKENAFALIEKQHKKLQEIDKTKNLFLANISHELRTPLNAIIGFSQALDSRMFGALNDKQAEYIKDIQISGLHLLGMINEILDLSKIESNAMKFCPVDLNPTNAINEVINILQPLYESKNIKIIFNNQFCAKIVADNQKFQQILYNLLSNAIKFTPNDGKIEIEQLQKGKNYILKIKDNGIGIDKKYHTKIFKKFVHLDNVYTKNLSSTGLGLTITKELVKLHKGKITLESELNKGSTFIMEFSNILKNE